LLRELLSEDGSIFIQIDDDEHAYLKILLDEIFGRKNFINNIVWKRRGGSANPKNRLNTVTDHVLWYSKTSNYKVNHIFSMNDDITQEYIKKRFINIDDAGRRFMKSPIQSPNYRPNLTYDYKGYKTPVKGYSISYELMQSWDVEGKLSFPDSKTQNINRKIYLDEYKGQPVSNLWCDIKVINPMSKERSDFDGGQKPEAFIERILTLATNENDLILDSFLGSGTTTAVAHKMNRRWIGIEMGEQAKTHCATRLQKVIDGEQGGISKDVNWQGGGGFRFYNLGESIFDQDGMINKNIKFEHLAAHIWFSETKTPLNQCHKKTENHI
jgi:adenine-specific DNA-methyltransferase